MKELNYWDRLSTLNIMSLQRRRERQTLLHVWKILNKVYPNTIDLNFKNHQRSGAIRAVLKLLPKLQGRALTVYEESFLIKAAKLWNILPPELSKITVLDEFKRKLLTFLKSIPDKPPLPGYPSVNDNSLTSQHMCLNLS